MALTVGQGGVSTICDFIVTPIPANTAEPIDYAWVPAPDAGQGTTTATYTAEVNPSNATTPLNYTWSPNPDIQADNTASYKWTTTGDKTISVGVSNCAGTSSVDDNHTVTISSVGTGYQLYLPEVTKQN